MERALSALERVLPVAAAVQRGVRFAALVALGAAAVIALALLSDWPDEAAQVVARVLVAAAVFVPGLILLAFSWALGQLVELPQRLRALPGEGRAHADELARILRERTGRRRLPLRAWRLLALGRSSRELLTPYAPLAPLFNPTFLFATLLSLLATPILALAALAALATLL